MLPPLLSQGDNADKSHDYDDGLDVNGKNIDNKVEDVFDGYNPTFDIDVDKIMGALEGSMADITLGTDEDKVIKKKLEGGETLI